MTKLTTLYAGRNLIMDVNFPVSGFPEAFTLDLSGNPMRNPPPDVIAQGTDAVRQYLIDQERPQSPVLPVVAGVIIVILVIGGIGVYRWRGR